MIGLFRAQGDGSDRPVAKIGGRAKPALPDAALLFGLI